MDRRENLIECVAEILKEENDVEVLESVIELLLQLRMKAGFRLREGLKNFSKTGSLTFIKDTPKQSCDSRLHNAPTSSPMMVKLEKRKEPNSDSRLNLENHPMNNEVVLKTIFQFSSVDTLKNCRLVSKKWRDLSFTSWRGKAVLQIAKLLNEPAHNENVFVEEFIKNRPQFKIQEVPFRSYNLCARRFDRLETVTKTILGLFFNSSIHYLSLECHNWDMLSVLLTKLPELRVLRLKLHFQNLCEQYSSIVSKGLPCPLADIQQSISKLRKLKLEMIMKSSNFSTNVKFPWKKLIQCVPALKSFSVGEGTRYAISEEIIKSICELRTESNFSTLELDELTIYFNMLYQYVQRIVSAKFPLRSLSTNQWDLVKAHANTLEYIKYGIGPNKKWLKPKQLCPPGSPFPSMYVPSRIKIKLPNLKKLVFKTSAAFSEFFEYPLDVPNLESLKIETHSSDYNMMRTRSSEQYYYSRLFCYSKMFKGSFILPNLKKFFYYEAWNFNRMELQILGNAMPNLTDLYIPMGDKIFPIVYELWPGLESLVFCATEETYEMLDDCSITGFPFDGAKEPCVSNITDLKNLRKFTLEKSFSCDGWDPLEPQKPLISDISAEYGFLLLPKLEILELYTACKFSPNVMGALKEHVSRIGIPEPEYLCSDGSENEDEAEKF